ncbi:MAG: PIN domain-containing protein [Candidatus Dadabacteria bacterium]|nr:PIN domain-containing protein [Candidatus Dadabacteria bacterium]
MKSQAVHVRNYSFGPQDKLFFDANIWMFLYGPQGQNNLPGNRMSVYSSAFSRILKAQSRIYIDVLIVSEFINTYARRKWEIFKATDRSGRGSESFKNFRNSSDFNPVAKEIADKTRRILKHCRKIESGFEILEMDSLIKRYENGGTDFNDQVFMQLCKNREFKLVTDDRDFKNQGISILTANGRLLR